MSSSGEELKAWAVAVSINGEEILCIERDYVSGLDITPERAEYVRLCARHLLAFVGDEDITRAASEGAEGER